MLYKFHEKGFAALASLRLTLVVLIVLLVCLFVGMFWDQTLTLDEHLSAINSDGWFFHVFRFFELNDVFHSWWFSLVVLALAINLTACSVERLPKIWIEIHNPPWPPTQRDFKTSTHKAKWSTPLGPDAKQAILQSFPKNTRQMTDESGTEYLFGEVHKYARTGVYVIHISLLMIMFGSIAATNMGIDGMLIIEEGSQNKIARVKGPGGVPYLYDIGFNVRCDDFRLKTYIDGSPMEFESDLAIYDPPHALEPKIKKTIRVNDPLQYKGYTFYQSSFQPLKGAEAVQLGIAPHGKDKTKYIVPIGKTIAMDDGTKIIPLEIYEDYAGLGEAVRVQLIENERSPHSFVVFRKYPDFDPLVRRGEWDVFYFGADQKFATGINVGNVPGVSLVFFGFVVMMVGLYMAFIMNHRRYLARISPASDGLIEVFIAGQARRHLYAFEEEFKNIENQIKSKVLS